MSSFKWAYSAVRKGFLTAQENRQGQAPPDTDGIPQNNLFDPTACLIVIMPIEVARKPVRTKRILTCFRIRLLVTV